MVYTGKPSRACATCKKRRIRCDEQRPSCGQCIKSKRECTGYKSESDLMFRDETNVTARRAAKKSSKSSTPSDSESGGEGPSQESAAQAGQPVTTVASKFSFRPLLDGTIEFGEPLPAWDPHWYQRQQRFRSRPSTALTTSARDRATAYFFNHFTLYNAEHVFSLYSILNELYLKSKPDDSLRAVTDALSLLTLSKRRGEERVRSEAHRAYADAVRKTAAAVADPVKVRDDETLLGVMMLGFSETMDTTASSHPSHAPRFAPDPEDPGIARFHHAWGAHALGAELIVKSRGSKDMQRSKNSLVLANQVRMQAVHLRNWVSQPMGDDDELWKSLADVQYYAFSQQMRLPAIGLKIPDLRWRGLNVIPKPMEPGLADEMVALLGEVKALDSDLVAQCQAVFSETRPQVAGYYLKPLSEDPRHDKAWPGAVHKHTSIATCNAINLYLTYRIYLQMLTFNLLERLIPPDELQTHPDFVACRRAIQSVANDICATVPYYLDYIQSIPLSPVPTPTPLGQFMTPGLVPAFVQGHRQHKSTRTTTSSSAQSSTTDQKDQEGPAMGAWYIVWPLWMCACLISISQQQRDWIQGRLAHIHDVHGIEHAGVYRRGSAVPYEPGKPRLFAPLDMNPPPWEPLQ